QYFYRDQDRIGKLGTNSWAGDPSYRGLSYNLEYKSDYLAWSAKMEESDVNYLTLLAWHRTNAKDDKGFNFYDNINLDSDYNLKLRNISTTNYSSGSRTIELQHSTFEGIDGIDIRYNGNGASLFLTKE